MLIDLEDSTRCEGCCQCYSMYLCYPFPDIVKYNFEFHRLSYYDDLVKSRSKREPTFLENAQKRLFNSES